MNIYLRKTFSWESLRYSITMYPQEIEKLIRLVLLFAKGFAFQKGSLFGFGPHFLIIKRLLRFTKPIVRPWKTWIKMQVSKTSVKKGGILAVLTMLALLVMVENSGICILPCCGKIIYKLIRKYCSSRIQKIPKPVRRYSGNQVQREWKNVPPRKRLQRKGVFEFKKWTKTLEWF